jgi:hypothetical protein
MRSNRESDTKSRVAALLGGLPELDPRPDLWSRIQFAHQRRKRQRRRRGMWVGAMLASAALVLVLLLPQSSEVDPGAAEPAAWQAQSHALEQEWLASSRESMDPRYRAELKLIDAQLQAAYDRGADPGELAPLWRLRSEALEELLRSDNGRVRAVTRI